MIEIEKKFHLTPEQEKKLLEHATFVKEVVNHDTYYDNETYDLTKNGLWFRKRNGRFELKVPLHKVGVKNVVTQQEELEDKQSIRDYLSLDTQLDFESAIKSKGYKSFVTYQTTRRRYKEGSFSIDLDSCDYGDGDPYLVAEIELMVEESGKEAGVKMIMDFISSKAVETGHARGKLPTYISRYRPEHYQVLLDAGIVYDES